MVKIDMFLLVMVRFVLISVWFMYTFLFTYLLIYGILVMDKKVGNRYVSK